MEVLPVCRLLSGIRDDTTVACDVSLQRTTCMNRYGDPSVYVQKHALFISAALREVTLVVPYSRTCYDIS